VTSGLCPGPETAGYLHTHERKPFSRIEGHYQHRGQSDSRMKPWNSQALVVMKPHKRVCSGRSENKIVSWKSLLFQNFLSSTSVGKRRFQRLRAYSWRSNRRQQISYFAPRSATPCRALEADRPVFSPGPGHVRSTNQLLVIPSLERMRAHREAAGTSVGL